MSNIEKEVNFLSKLDNIYVVKYFNSWLENENMYCIRMEYCSHNLMDIIRYKNSFEPNLNSINYYISCELFKEILECVKYLHSMSPPIIHRDLKPANILITEKPNNGRYIKLCDFELAVEHKNLMTHTKERGTDGYIAPEVIIGRTYNTKADIYSLGILANVLFSEELVYVLKHITFILHISILIIIFLV